ncbi:hypothetical protein D3C76_1224280 [compost metagenome]
MRYAVKPGGINEIIECAKILVKPDIIRQIPDFAFNPKCFPGWIEAAYFGLPLRRFRKPQHHKNRRRFARSVRTKQAEDFTPGDA